MGLRRPRNVLQFRRPVKHRRSAPDRRHAQKRTGGSSPAPRRRSVDSRQCFETTRPSLRRLRVPRRRPRHGPHPHRILVPVFRPRPHTGSEASSALLDRFARRGRRGRSPQSPLPVLPLFMGPKAARRWRARPDSCREGAARTSSSFHGPASHVCRLNFAFAMTMQLTQDSEPI